MLLPRQLASSNDRPGALSRFQLERKTEERRGEETALEGKEREIHGGRYSVVRKDKLQEQKKKKRESQTIMSLTSGITRMKECREVKVEEVGE